MTGSPPPPPTPLRKSTAGSTYTCSRSTRAADNGERGPCLRNTREKKALRWAAARTVSGRKVSSCRLTSERPRSDATSMTRQRTSEGPARPRYEHPDILGMNIQIFSRVAVGILMLLIFLQVIPLYPKVGYVEMNPDAIWKGFISVAKGAVQGMVGAFHSFSACKLWVN